MPDIKRAAFKLGSVDDHQDIPVQNSELHDEDVAALHKSRKNKAAKRPKDVHIVHTKHNPHRHHQRAPSGGKVILTDDGAQVSPLLPRTRSTTSLSKARAKAVRNASESQLSKYHMRQTSEEEEPDEDNEDVDYPDTKSPELITPLKESTTKSSEGITAVDEFVDSNQNAPGEITNKINTLSLDDNDNVSNSPEKIEFPKSKPRTKSPSPPQKSPAAPPQISTDQVESIPRSRPSSIYSVRRPPSLLSLTSIASDARSPGRVRRLASTSSSVEPQLTQMNAISSDLSTNRSLKSKFIEEGQTAATTLLRQQTGRKTSTTVQPNALRMQQKLLLQRDEPGDRITTLEAFGLKQDDLEPEQQMRLIREIERVNREYAYIIRYRDAMEESLQRCFAIAGRSQHQKLKSVH